MRTFFWGEIRIAEGGRVVAVNMTSVDEISCWILVQQRKCSPAIRIEHRVGGTISSGRKHPFHSQPPAKPLKYLIRALQNPRVLNRRSVFLRAGGRFLLSLIDDNTFCESRSGSRFASLWCRHLKLGSHSPLAASRAFPRAYERGGRAADLGSGNGGTSTTPIGVVSVPVHLRRTLSLPMISNGFSSNLGDSVGRGRARGDCR